MAAVDVVRAVTGIAAAVESPPVAADERSKGPEATRASSANRSNPPAVVDDLRLGLWFGDGGQAIRPSPPAPAGPAAPAPGAST